MKKHHLAIVGGLVLLIGFGVAAYVYKGHRANKTESMAQASDSPLNRAYAQSLGPDDAKVVIVEFFDPGCETCRLFAAPVKGLVNAYPGKVRLVKRYAPFHQGADVAAQILEAARRQNKYWETLQVMFDYQPQWASHHHPQPELIWQFLPEAGVDVEQLRADMNDAEILEVIRQDIDDAKALGVRKTPEFIVNGKRLQSFGYPQLEALVAAEVAAQYGGSD